MAHTATHTSTQGYSPLVDFIRANTATLRARYAQYRVYRTTLNELSNLTGRELADLGVHRSMIKSIAMDAAYGK